jgi:hypothetical protein
VIRTAGITAFLIGSCLVYPASTLGDSFNAGIIVGDPTGLSFKGWLNSTQAYDIAASWSNGSTDKRYLHTDYLNHDYTLIKVPNGDLPVYYGLGARLLDENNRKTKLGIRIPVGLDYLMDKIPLSLFVEVVPTLDVTPDTDFALDAALGIRYRFSMPDAGQQGAR